MGAIMGLDYGTVRVGIAIGDAAVGLAFPRVTVPAQPFATLCATLRATVRDEDVSALVVGVPLRADGSAGDAAVTVRAWGERLGDALERPVHFVDEGLTSDAVRSRRRAQGRAQSPRSGGDALDAEAAAMILQEYFDHRVIASRA